MAKTEDADAAHVQYRTLACVGNAGCYQDAPLHVPRVCSQRNDRLVPKPLQGGSIQKATHRLKSTMKCGASRSLKTRVEAPLACIRKSTTPLALLTNRATNSRACDEFVLGQSTTSPACSDEPWSKLNVKSLEALFKQF